MLAKQLNSHKDIAQVIIMEVVDSVFGFLPLHVSQEMASEINKFFGQLIE